MIVLRPIAMTDAQLISSTVPEPDTGETAYNPATTYAAGNTVSVIATDSHKKYESLQGGNTGNTPVAAPNETTWWADLGNTNRWRMFDNYRSNKTIGTSPMTVVRRPGQVISALSLIGIVGAETAEITIKDGSSVTRYSKTIDLRARIVTNWYEFFYEPFSNTKAIVLSDIPPISDPEITIALTGASSQIELGGNYVGSYVEIGNLRMGASAPRTNYSTVERNFDSSINVMTPRPRRPTVKGELIVTKNRLDKVMETLDALDARVSVFSGLAEITDGYFQTFLINGFARVANPKIENPDHAFIEIEIEEI